MSDTPETPRRAPRALTVLAGIAIVFLLLAGLYVGYQTMHILFPPNTYETAMLATVSDTVDAEGVLLFNESDVAGGGTLGIWQPMENVFRRAPLWQKFTAMLPRRRSASSSPSWATRSTCCKNRRMLPQPSWTPCGKSVPPPCMT